jgi:hypothetical protein
LDNHLHVVVARGKGVGQFCAWLGHIARSVICAGTGFLDGDLGVMLESGCAKGEMSKKASRSEVVASHRDLTFGRAELPWAQVQNIHPIVQIKRLVSVAASVAVC